MSFSISSKAKHVSAFFFHPIVVYFFFNFFTATLLLYSYKHISVCALAESPLKDPASLLDELYLRPFLRFNSLWRTNYRVSRRDINKSSVYDVLWGLKVWPLGTQSLIIYRFLASSRLYLIYWTFFKTLSLMRHRRSSFLSNKLILGFILSDVSESAYSLLRST